MYYKERYLAERLKALTEGVKREIVKAEYAVSEGYSHDPVPHSFAMRELIRELHALCDDPLGEKSSRLLK